MDSSAYKWRVTDRWTELLLRRPACREDAYGRQDVATLFSASKRILPIGAQDGPEPDFQVPRLQFLMCNVDAEPEDSRSTISFSRGKQRWPFSSSSLCRIASLRHQSWPWKASSRIAAEYEKLCHRMCPSSVGVSLFTTSIVFAHVCDLESSQLLQPRAVPTLTSSAHYWIPVSWVLEREGSDDLPTYN